MCVLKSSTQAVFHFLSVISLGLTPPCFRLDKIMNCNLASAALLIPDTHTSLHIRTHTHTHTCPVMHLCVSLLTWMFGVTVDFKLHFLCLQLLRPALSPELHEDRIDTVSAVNEKKAKQKTTSVCFCLEPV